MPRVSVIMNIRDGASTLREALDSAVSQSFTDWELIAWDDCSRDNSADVVRRYPDPRIRYLLSPAETPLGPARREAIAQATGEWLAFLDQDDIWLPRKLERQLALADAADVGLIYGRTVRFFTNGCERDYDQAHEFTPLPEGNIFHELFANSCFIAMSSAMIRRKALELAGGIPSDVSIIPDYCMYVGVARKFRARAVQEVVCRYRVHHGSTSQVSARQVHAEALQLIDKWAADLDAGTVDLCRRRHATQLALAEMKSPGSFFSGLRRLMARGSPASQLVRPWFWAFHIVRRNVLRPYWRGPSE